MVATEAEFVTDNQALMVRSSDALMPALSMQQAVERYAQIKEFVMAVMDQGRDFGTIPGAGKDKVLLKPGAEKLCTLFNLKPRLVILDQTEDWLGSNHGGEPFFSYHYKIQLYRNEEFMGEADAALNSWEEKYRWRSSARKCPACGADSIINGKKEYGGGFICFAKKGGCGAKFKDGDASITGQQTGRVPNDRIFDQINTMRKMCYKRALIAATLVAVNASDFFTQDLDAEEEAYPSHVASPEPPPDYDEPARPARITPEMRKKLGDTAKGRKIPTEIASSIVQRFGFAETKLITVDKYNDVMQALCDWEAPEAVEQAEERLESAPVDMGGNAPDNAQIQPSPALSNPMATSEKDSLEEKRKEIDSLGQQLLNAGVPMKSIQSVMESKTLARESKNIKDAYDANACIVALESLLERATKAQQANTKREA